MRMEEVSRMFEIRLDKAKEDIKYGLHFRKIHGPERERLGQLLVAPEGVACKSNNTSRYTR